MKHGFDGVPGSGLDRKEFLARAADGSPADER
jgi:hypothetical protein